MAKQLYNYWFVQFDFPNEEGKPYKSNGGKMVWNDFLKRNMPEGWLVGYVKEFIAPIERGISYSSEEIASPNGFPMLNLACYSKAGDYRVGEMKYYSGHIKEEYKVFPFTLLIACTDMTQGADVIGRPILATEEYEWYVFSMDLAKITPNNIGKMYLYYTLRTPFYHRYIKPFASGTTVKHLNVKGVEDYKIAVPPICLQKSFENTIEDIKHQQMLLMKETLLLTKLRDELLPLLMNGQVSVNYDLLLCLFAQILYNATKNPMKEEVKTRIVTAMAQNLTPEQLLFLNTVLNDNFKNLEIKPLDDEMSQRNNANNELLNAFISAKKIEGCSDKTLHYYRSSIEALLAKLNKKIDVIVTNDIRNYLSDYQEERLSSRVTIDNLRRIFSSFFAWLEDEDYIGKSPVRRIHKVRTESLVKEVLSDENMEVLRDTCHEIRDLAMIDLLASTGMRVGELAKMNREDIDFQERQCVVFGKGNKEREVYFNARTKIHLKRYLESRKDTNPALFVSLSTPHNRLTISGVEVRLRQLGRKAGINKVHPHKFRRTLATMAIDKGMPIEQVQKLLGHVKIDTTLHYAMVNQTNVKIAHRKFIG